MQQIRAIAPLFSIAVRGVRRSAAFVTVSAHRRWRHRGDSVFEDAAPAERNSTLLLARSRSRSGTHRDVGHPVPHNIFRTSRRDGVRDCERGGAAAVLRRYFHRIPDRPWADRHNPRDIGINCRLGGLRTRSRCAITDFSNPWLCRTYYRLCHGLLCPSTMLRPFIGCWGRSPSI